MNPVGRIVGRLGALKRRFGVLTLESAGGAKIAVIGDDTYAESTARRYFCGDAVVRRTRRLRVGSILATAERLSRRYGMVVVSNVRVGDEVGDLALRCPWFVELDVALPSSVEDYRRRLPERFMRETRQLEKLFTWDLSQCGEHLKQFREDFYLPTVRASHGSEAYEASEQEMEDHLRRGYLLRVFFDGEWVAGLLVAMLGQSLRLRQVGLRNGDRESLPRLSSVATYWLLIRHAIESGVPSIDFGRTPPDPGHGLYSFKEKFGVRVNERRTHRAVHYFVIDPSHSKCRRFFEDHSIFFWEGEKLSLLTGVGNQDELAALQQRARSLAGIERVYSIRRDYVGGLASGSGVEGLPVALRTQACRIR